MNKSKITATTITKYIEYLEDAFLIEEARRYDIKGKSYIGTPMKYYFMDLGLRSASSRLIKKEFPQIRKSFWKEMFWSRSSCLLTTGGANIDTIRRYIETQGEKRCHR